MRLEREIDDSRPGGGEHTLYVYNSFFFLYLNEQHPDLFSLVLRLSTSSICLSSFS